MYHITDAQVAYIMNDIRRNGVQMEDLQLNLLDHICCIIESELGENDDFERFYHTTVHRFYKHDLREIEEETIKLLTFKNYYKMKKVMIVTGLMSAVFFIVGSTFKVMHWPGASVMLVLAVLLISFIFLPLMFVLRSKEINERRGRVVLGMGVVVAIMYCISMLMGVMHWPGSRVVWLSTLLLSFFVFVPAYFFTGIRRAETKVNTIFSTVLIIAVIGIQFILTSVRPADHDVKVYSYIQNEQLLALMQHGHTTNSGLASEIQGTCEQIKDVILSTAGVKKPVTAETLYLDDNVRDEFYPGQKGNRLLVQLKEKVLAYNATKKAGGIDVIPTRHSILDMDFNNIDRYTKLFVLNSITQIQLFVANAEREDALSAR